MELQKGDVLLVKRTGGRSSKPANPAGQVYSDRNIPLFGGTNPAYHRGNEGDVICVELIPASGTLKGKWKNTTEPFDSIFKKWKKKLTYRDSDLDYTIALDQVPDDYKFPDEYTQEQTENNARETEERDEWNERSSELMSDLGDL
ncbi:hypothetical protein [Halorubrum sp. AJ67]|uniref:hypothetical protein n=1 Tax=Halorubrum sp. AJ67 TaxID=1173487 RepID=UPI0003DBA561|nr:hypothetical protein [Halorubrum sp. AJ67]CDK38180.1 hypothetical protein BN903_380 [Halorubrum sp. AJ67]